MGQRVAVVVLAVAAIAAAVSCRSSDSSTGAGPSVPTVPATSWSTFALPGVDGGPVATVTGVTHVALGSGSWWAYGTTQAAPGVPRQPAVWSSSDGTGWSADALSAPAGGAGEVQAVGSSPDLAVAAGTVGPGAWSVPAVWTRTATGGWSAPVALPLPVPQQGMIVTGVAHNDHGWVVVGHATLTGNPSVAWHSADGVSWARAGHQPPDPIDDPVDTMRLIGVTATADQFVGLLSVRDTFSGTGWFSVESVPSLDPAVWVSSDGDTWTSHPLVPARGPNGTSGSTPIGVDSIAAVGGQLLVRGWPTGLLSSVDGSTWAAIDTPGAGAPGASAGSGAGTGTGGAGAEPAVAATSMHDVALGSDGTHVFESGRNGAALTMVQGTLPLPTGTTMTGRSGGAASLAFSPVDLPPELASVDPRMDASVADRPLVAVDASGVLVSQPSTTQQRFWLRSASGAWQGLDVHTIPPPRRTATADVRGLATDGHAVVAVGALVSRRSTYEQEETGGRAWSSADGRVWSVAAVPSDVTAIQAVTARPGGFIAVGYRGTASKREAVLLSSTDGGSWSESPISDPPTAFVPTAVAARDRQVIMVGAGTFGDTSSLWSSPDGHAWTPQPAGPPSVRWRGVCATKEGFYAVGDAVTPVVWASSDGQSWSAETLPSDHETQSVRPSSCAVSSDGRVVVLGQAGDGGADAIVRDPSGTWSTHVVTYSSPTGGDTQPNAVIATAAGFIAVGNDNLRDVSGDADVWTSRTGTDQRWPAVADPTEILSGPGVQDLRAGVVVGNRVFLGGQTDDAPVVMTGPGPA